MLGGSDRTIYPQDRIDQGKKDTTLYILKKPDSLKQMKMTVYVNIWNCSRGVTDDQIM